MAVIVLLPPFHSPAAVGYQNKAVEGGVYNMNVGTFLAVGKAKADMTFGDLQASRTFLFGENNIMTLQPEGGRTGDIITYLSAEEASEYGIEGLKPGWYDKDYVSNVWNWTDPIPEDQCWNEKKLPYGTMVVVQGSDGATINYAGEVLSANHQFVIVGGVYNMIGNATPVDLILGDFVASRTFLFGENNIMTLQPEGGRTGDIITYLSAEEASEYGIEGLKPGWYDKDYVSNTWNWTDPIPDEQCFNNLPIPAGYGFIAQGSEGATIELPSPIAE